MHTVGEWWMWLSFAALILIVLSVDLFLLGGRRSHAVSLRESLGWTIIWVVLALAFNLFLWWYVKQTQGPLFANQKALEFFTGYLIEESLSIDNMFVFVMIFNYFSVPPAHQRRILLYGVLGAIFMRFILILLGIWLISKFHWILYVFGLFLIVTGIKMLLAAHQDRNLSENRVLIWLRNHIRISEEFQGDHFFIKKNGLTFATPLFIVLVLIEVSDLIFAVDSIPAIFAITKDPFIVFTSNIFAILGLRSLYFLLTHLIQRFHLLQYGLALVLVFVGSKMLIVPWIQIPIVVALGIISVILITFILLSFILSPKALQKKQ